MDDIIIKHKVGHQTVVKRKLLLELLEKGDVDTIYCSFDELNMGDIEFNEKNVKPLLSAKEEVETAPSVGVNPDISRFKDTEEGRCFILATGPSAGDLDLRYLKDEKVIGVGRAEHLTDSIDYGVLLDKRVMEENPEFFQLDIPYFTSTIGDFSEEDDVEQIYYLGTYGFSKDLSKGAYVSNTSTHLALQLAVYLGFEEIYIVGADFNHNEAINAYEAKEDNEILKREKKDHEDNFGIMIQGMLDSASILNTMDVQTYLLSDKSSLTELSGQYKQVDPHELWPYGISSKGDPCQICIKRGGRCDYHS